MQTPQGPFDVAPRVEAIEVPLAVGPLLNSLRGAVDPVVLESGQDVAGTGTWHVLAACPCGHATIRGPRWVHALNGRVTEGDAADGVDPLTRVEQWWQSWSTTDGLPEELAAIGAPFAGGAIGYFGYELGAYCEDGASRPTGRRLDLTQASPFAADIFEAIPDLQLYLYDEVLLIERETGAGYFVHRGRAGVESRRWWEQAAAAESADESKIRPVESASVSLSDADYLAAVGEVRSLIAEGAVYEVNLTRCHRFDGGPSAWQLFQRLRAAQPVPYGALLPWSPVAVVSASPECFLRRRGRDVETRPIKGTAPRTGDASRDEEAKHLLLASEKERAELAMIIDVERNDLGRVCDVGSVVVVEEAALEPYATVFHTVATVRGRLPERCTPFELLRATFPGGSITGAPKIAAMEAIRRFETCPRRAYTGSIGWIAPDGDLDLSIAIRTALRCGDTTLFAVGGAVTWDSVPQRELEELGDKGRAVFRAIGVAPDS